MERDTGHGMNAEKCGFNLGVLRLSRSPVPAATGGGPPPGSATAAREGDARHQVSRRGQLSWSAR
jgi:hypothetical protein